MSSPGAATVLEREEPSETISHPTNNGDATSPSSSSLPIHLAILYVAVRISLANKSPITDCDEVYNYWEPVHFLHYGTGMQTWEYAPQYALRTYAYLIPMAFLSKVYECTLQLLSSTSIIQVLKTAISPGNAAFSPSPIVSSVLDKPLIFHLLRCTVAAFTSISELHFHNAVHKTISPHIANWTLFLLLTSAGMFHASAAYLPSSTVMTLWMFSASNQLRGYDDRAIICGLLATLGAGWPFCAVLFVTTGLWSMWNAWNNILNGTRSSRKNKFQEECSNTLRVKAVIRLLLRTALHASVIQVIVMAVDLKFYGKVLSPIWNIFVYNAHGGGDELYGVEPLSYYIKNVVLNFNVVGVLGVISLPFMLIRWLVSEGKLRSLPYGKMTLVLLPMYIWLGIVMLRPHKEERFLFPIYPPLCFGAAIMIHEILDLIDTLVRKVGKADHIVATSSGRKLLYGLILLTPAAVISFSRSLALSTYYTAPLAVYTDFYHHAITNKEDKTRNTVTDSGKTISLICTGGEWYRFPSSYHLPPGYQLGFLKSNFSGQLPQPFSIHGSRYESTEEQTGQFNDANREELDRYVDITDCSYIIELVPDAGLLAKEQGKQPECLTYMQQERDKWKEVLRYNFLDAARTGMVHRILYLPFSDQATKVRFSGYVLYERIKP